MKVVQIKSLTDFMMGKSTWQTATKDIYHEDYEGVVNPEMIGKEYTLDINHKIPLSDGDFYITVAKYNRLVGTVPQNIEVYGWMLYDKGKYVPSIEEIINLM